MNIILYFIPYILLFDNNSGINNDTEEGRRRLNIKSGRFSVDGEVTVLLWTSRTIPNGERLYYDYNALEEAFPISTS